MTGKEGASGRNISKWFGLSTRWLAAAIGLFAMLLYANTLGHEFAQDDAIVITSNTLVQQGFQGIPQLLTEDSFFGFFNTEGKSRLVSGGRYRPLTLLMFAVEYELFGEKPFMGHLVNMLLYGITAIVIFQLMLLIASGSSLSKQRILFAVVVAAVFAAHPIHTEAVANIKGRDEIMALLLSLSAVYIVLRSPWLRILNWVAAGSSFLLALLAKENAITFLAVAPLMILLFTKKSVRQIVLDVFPFMAATVLFLVVRGQVIGWDLGDPPRELMNNPFLKLGNGTYIDFTFSERMATIAYILGKYVQLLLFPYPLTHDYYPRQIDLMRWSDWRVIASVVIYTALIITAIVGILRRSITGFGVAFYLITLSIVSNIVFPVGTNMSERFAYMPSLGYAMVIGGLAVRLSRAVGQKAALAASGSLLVVLSVLTVTRNPVWKNNETLFLTDVHTSSSSAKLLVAASGTLLARVPDSENASQREADVQQAIAYLRKAQSMHPNYKISHLLLGNAYFHRKDWVNAIESYRRVLILSPGDPEGENNLGIAYRQAGNYYGQIEKDIPKALEYLHLAYELIPDDLELLLGIGAASGMAGQLQAAVSYFERAAELYPENASVHYNLFLAYRQMGDLEKAGQHQQIAVRLNPNIFNR